MVKRFMRYRPDKIGHTDRMTDGQADGGTDAQSNCNIITISDIMFTQMARLPVTKLGGVSLESKIQPTSVKAVLSTRSKRSA